MQTNKQQLVPALRFPEFEGEWKRVKLGEVIQKLVTGKSVNSDGRPAEEEEYGILKTSAVVLEGFKPEENKVIIKEEELKRAKEHPTKNTILISRMNTPNLVGQSTYIDKDYPNLFLPDRLWKAVFSSNGKVNVQFIAHSLKAPKTYYTIQFLATGTSNSMKNISKSSFLNIKLPIPSLPEQQKIANFLSVLDKKKALLRELSQHLESFKKGLMQQLFNQQVRFLDENGEAFADWKQTTLSYYLRESKIKGDTGDRAKKLTVKLWGKGVFEKEEIHKGSANTQYYIRKANQIIYSKLDFLNCAFGIIPQELDNYQSTLDLPCFDVGDNGDRFFIINRIKEKNFYKKYGDTANGTRKAKRIHPKDFLKFPIKMPTLPEQKKIAACLSLLDQKIQNLQAQLEAMEEYKKGLMQQLLV